MRKTCRGETCKSEACETYFKESYSSEARSQDTDQIEDRTNEDNFSRKFVESGSNKGFSLRFDNPDFGDRDSKIFSVSSNHNSSISTSRSASDSFHQRKEIASTVVFNINSKLSISNPKNSMSQRTRKYVKSSDSLDYLGNNLELRKTEEISDFSMKNRDDSRVMKKAGLQRAVERLAVADEKRARRSDLSGTSGTELSLFNFEQFGLQTGECYDRNEEVVKCFPTRETRDRRDYKEGSIREFGSTKQSKKKVVEIKTPRKRLTEKFVDPEVPLAEDLQTKKYFRDLLFYIVYLVAMTIIALSMVTSEMYFFTHITSTLFLDSYNINSSSPVRIFKRDSKGRYLQGRMLPDNSPLYPTLRQAHTIDDFWRFAETTMLDLFYWNFFYFQLGVSVYGEDDDKKRYFENQILGVPRLRQVRVKRLSCKIHPAVKKFFKECYYYYTPFTEETANISAKPKRNPNTTTAWVYSNAKELRSSYYMGQISTYGGGGYYLDLDRTKEVSRRMIEDLKKNDWITKATRAVFIDFNIYNANVNLFCLCKIVVEFPPVGGMLASADFRAIKAIRYLNPFDFFVLGLEFFMVVCTLLFAHSLIHELRTRGMDFFLCFRNYLNFVIVLLLLAAIILNVVRHFLSEKLVRTLEERYTKYTEFGTLKYLHYHLNNIVAVLAFASWIKLFTFLTFNAIMLEFQRTLALSLKGSLLFLPMFLNAYIAFAILANLLFGDQVKDYATLYSSSVSLFQAFLGDFRYRALQEANWVLGSAFCLAFIFFMFFIFMNLFIAIVVHAYSKVKADVYLVKPRICTYAKRGLINTFTCCRPRKRLRETLSRKKRRVFREIHDALERAGFSKDDIQVFFAKYNITAVNVLDGRGWRLKEEMELERVDYNDIREHQVNVLRRRLDSLISRIEVMELSLQPIIDKVDMLLDRFNVLNPK